MAEFTFAEVLDRTTEACRTMDAPLSKRLEFVADTVRDLQRGFADVVDRMVARLDDNGVGLDAPRPGARMPPFVLPDQDGRLVRLSDLTANGPVDLVQSRPLVPVL